MTRPAQRQREAADALEQPAGKAAGRERKQPAGKATIERAVARLAARLAGDPASVAAELRQFAAQFHVYSPNNRWHIAAQRPGATFLRGRRQWEVLGRTVKKNARAIFIYVPLAPAGRGGYTSRFGTQRVYDVADTEGPPFEIPSLPPVERDDARRARLLADLEGWVRESGLGFRRDSPLPNLPLYGATNGAWIYVSPWQSEDARLSTLAHEIGHVLLHFKRRERGGAAIVEPLDQARAHSELELQAELFAYLLLALSGIDAGPAVADYLRSWGATPEELVAAVARVRPKVTSVLRACERKTYRVLLRREPTGTAAAVMPSPERPRAYRSARPLPNSSPPSSTSSSARAKMRSARPEQISAIQ